MLQRYDLVCVPYMGDDLRRAEDGDWCRWDDVEPLLPKWVSVKERSPCSGMYYTVLCNGESRQAYLCQPGVWLMGVPAVGVLHPTHWLEVSIPSLPPQEKP